MTQTGLVLGGAGIGYLGHQIYLHKSLAKPNKGAIAVAVIGAALGYWYFKSQAAQASG